MRFLMTVRFPNEEFNTAVRDGSAGKKINKILEKTKPESVYFTEQDGHRTGILAVDITNPSEVPTLAEPGSSSSTPRWSSGSP